MTGPLQYNAQSPDEAALVSAARNFGYVFLVTIAVGGVASHVASFVAYRIVHLAPLS